MEYTYRAFGLTIGSDLPLPGLPAGQGTPEIRIKRSVIPAWSGESIVQYGERCHIRGQEWHVRFKAFPFSGLIRDGKLIEYEADPSLDEIAGLHVLGSCTGALLFQRGLVPIHANTVMTPNGAVMMAGRIGAGKSATTMALVERGHRLLADDISAVSFPVAGRSFAHPEILPGFPRIKLWDATLKHFQRDTSQLRRLRSDLNKFHFPVEQQFCSEPQELTAIYILQPRDVPGVRIRAVSGLDKLQWVRRHLYKIRFRDAIRNFPPLLTKVCHLANSVRVNLVERPKEGDSIEAVANAIESDVSKAGRLAVAG